MVTQQQIPLFKKRLFTVVLFLIPFIFFLLLELTLTLFKVGGNLNLFISGPREIKQYKMCNQDVGRRYFFMQRTIPGPTKDLILKQKPKNGYRFFVLGASTAAGFPYGNNLMFSRILHYRLQDVFPELHIEFMNVAMSAINSYTLLDFMDEILRHQPDAILIYTGHNEFYGALGSGSLESVGKNRWAVKTYLRLTRFRTFLILRNLIGQIRQSITKSKTGGSLTDPSNTLMEQLVAEQKIPYGENLYQIGMKQFKNNLEEIIRKAKKHEIPVLLSELVSNVRDQKPFISEKTDSLPAANELFLKARHLENNKKYTQARDAYYRSKDLDQLRFRAPEDFNRIIHRLGSQYDCPVVPMKSYFGNASKNRLIGDQLMIDHLHPNIDGYFLMAEAFFKTLKKNHFISEFWNPERILPIETVRKYWGLTELDSLSGWLGIQYLKGGWPFQPKALPNRSLGHFQAKTKVESLAVDIVNRSSSLATGHYLLAQHYEKKNQYRLALNEYKALIFSIPYEIEFYERAAENLIRLNEFDQALSILKKSHQIGETAKTNKVMGQVLFKKGNVEKAIQFFERSRRLNPHDASLLYSLSQAYCINLEIDKAQSIFQVLKKYYPIFLDKQKESVFHELVQKVRSNASLYLKKAKYLRGEKRYQEALDILIQSLKIQETHMANLLIGELLLKKNEIKKSIPFLEKACNVKNKNPQALYYLSVAYVSDREYEKAKQTIKQLDKISPDFPDPFHIKDKLD